MNTVLPCGPVGGVSVFRLTCLSAGESVTRFYVRSRALPARDTDLDDDQVIAALSLSVSRATFSNDKVTENATAKLRDAGPAENEHAISARPNS